MQQSLCGHGRWPLFDSGGYAARDARPLLLCSPSPSPSLAAEFSCVLCFASPLSRAQVQRETGRKAQLSNIQAGKAVSDIIRTTLGPRSMLKMLLDPMGGIVITNDGNCILREVDVSHPTAKSMIELARAQDEEVGDGTTSVIVIAGEVLQCAGPLIERNLHPTVIVAGYTKALAAAIKVRS